MLFCRFLSRIFCSSFFSLRASTSDEQPNSALHQKVRGHAHFSHASLSFFSWAA